MVEPQMKITSTIFNFFFKFPVIQYNIFICKILSNSSKIFLWAVYLESGPHRVLILYVPPSAEVIMTLVFVYTRPSLSLIFIVIYSVLSFFIFIIV